MGSGVSLRSFGVLLLFIGHSMVLVSGRLCSGEKTVLDANANGVKTTLVMPDKLLTGTFTASNVSIPRNGNDAMIFDLTFELKEDEIKFAQKSGLEFPISCSPTFTPDGFKYTIDVDVRLKKPIPGMKFEFDATRKGIHDGKCGGDEELCTGWVALIVHGVLDVLAIIAFCIYWFWYRPKHTGKQTVQ
ncbi:hypothetical protein M3Y96_00410400 [Aphelenchoides besseyi]|nr:hypothetical protein M3Y96_00410400 [Aphelenchoides besseyi]